jgi:hypothetical protein
MNIRYKLKLSTALTAGGAATSGTATAGSWLFVGF